MSYGHYARLSDAERATLDSEDHNAHTHKGFVAIFESGELGDEDGGVDFERIRDAIEDGLRRLPRFRQKLSYASGSDEPVWIDDVYFNVLYHLRHTSLPFPGDERHLKRLVGRILSQKLDRAKPLWEFWIVEGLSDDRFALIAKVHETLTGDDPAADLLSRFSTSNPDETPHERSQNWFPREPPGGARMLYENVLHRIAAPGRALQAVAEAAGRPGETLEAAMQRAGDFARTLDASRQPRSKTRFNVPIGPHRRFDATRFEFEAMEDVVDRHGGTVADVVLACVTTAVRGTLTGHGQNARDTEFCIRLCGATLMDIRCDTLGKEISSLIVSVPLAPADSRQRYQQTLEETSRLIDAGRDGGRRDANLAIEFTCGPETPVYLAGARLSELYPLTPLVSDHALAIAALYYDGHVYCGFNSDYDVVTDLHDFVGEVEHEFETLRKLELPAG